MGFYIRKSLRVGPFRFNLSKSGVGVSTGIRGLRIGTGPRGNYVHMGAGGIYYRSTLPRMSGAGRTGGGPPGTPASLPLSPAPLPAPGAASGPVMVDIESGDVSQIVDATSQDLIDEINAKRRRPRYWPLALVATLGVLFYAVWHDWVASVVVPVAIGLGAGVIYVYLRDQVAKTVVLMYDFDPPMEAAYTAFHAAAIALGTSAKVWHVASSAKVRDAKYHAGANQVVRRAPTSVAWRSPRYVKANLNPLAIGVGAQTLYFFPDRLLIEHGDKVGAVAYAHLTLARSSIRFIEEQGAPRDAKVVDRTWKYVNRDGGPDRRFRDNPEHPVCEYDELDLTTSSGLHERLQASKPDVLSQFVDGIRQLARAIRTP